MMKHISLERRGFIKRSFMGGCALALAGYTLDDFLLGEQEHGLRVGFQNDAPAELWRWSRPAKWAETMGRLVQCRLCPHECILGENDRGFCRTRVVKNGALHTLAYGNPCAIHLDPMEKKPLYHFLPGSSILSIATAGCNLRCLNCQNWQISQARPEDLDNDDLMPDSLVELTANRRIRSLAYTYSEPVVYYEYVMDTAGRAMEKGIRNVLVTAGYILEKPLRDLCRVADAANVDLKGFTDGFYKKITGARLAPVMRCLEIMREEGVWLEVTRLVVPTLSDDMNDIRAMCDWLAAALGPDVPLHLSRFHPQYKLQHLPPTPFETMEKAYLAARAAGLRHIYVGNVPGSERQDTICPACGSRVLERRGFLIMKNLLRGGRCPCGAAIPGVWS